MAHATLHFAIGMAVGTAIAVPAAAACRRARGPLAPLFARWILLSYGLGVLAVAPGALRRIGCPPSVCDGWWMNVFLGYPLLNLAVRGGMLWGTLGIIAVFAIQYLLLLAAVHAARRRRTSHDTARV